MSEKVSGTLLVVDDEEAIRQAIVLYASSIGLDCLEAGDANEAMEIVKSKNPDVIISDLVMPGISGVEFLTSLRKEGNLTPFIIVTGFGSKESAVESLRQGAFDFVEKPFNGEKLQKLLKQAVMISTEDKNLQDGGSGMCYGDMSPEDALRLELGIRKMRHLRYIQDEEDKSKPNVQRLIEFFISETAPQLFFCEASIEGMNNKDERDMEISYLFKVMRAVHENACLLKAMDVSELAKGLYNVFTVFRANPELITSADVDYLKESNLLLKQEVENLGDPEIGDNKAEIRTKVEELRKFLSKKESV